MVSVGFTVPGWRVPSELSLYVLSHFLLPLYRDCPACEAPALLGACLGLGGWLGMWLPVATPCLGLPGVLQESCFHPEEAVGGQGSLGALKLVVAVRPFAFGNG